MCSATSRGWIRFITKPQANNDQRSPRSTESASKGKPARVPRLQLRAVMCVSKNTAHSFDAENLSLLLPENRERQQSLSWRQRPSDWPFFWLFLFHYVISLRFVVSFFLVRRLDFLICFTGCCAVSSVGRAEFLQSGQRRGSSEGRRKYLVPDRCCPCVAALEPRCGWPCVLCV